MKKDFNRLYAIATWIGRRAYFPYYKISEFNQGHESEIDKMQRVFVQERIKEAMASKVPNSGFLSEYPKRVRKNKKTKKGVKP